MKKVTCKFFDIIVKLKVALYASKIGLTKLNLTLNPNPNTILHLYLKNLTNKRIESIAFVQGRTVCKAQEKGFKGKLCFNYCHLPNPICRALREGNIRSQCQNRCSVVSGLLSQKALITILNIHFH